MSALPASEEGSQLKVESNCNLFLNSLHRQDSVRDPSLGGGGEPTGWPGTGHRSPSTPVTRPVVTSSTGGVIAPSSSVPVLEFYSAPLPKHHGRWCPPLPHDFSWVPIFPFLLRASPPISNSAGPLNTRSHRCTVHPEGLEAGSHSRVVHSVPCAPCPPHTLAPALTVLEGMGLDLVCVWGGGGDADARVL